MYRQSGEGQKEMIEDTIGVLLEKHEKSHTLAREPIKITSTMQRSETTLSFPAKVSIAKGRIAISDSNHNRIIITDLSGKIEHIIGSGKIGLVDGKFSESAFFRPQGVVWKDDSLFVADTYNSAVRVIDLDNEKVLTIIGKHGIDGICKLGDPNCDTLGLYEPSDVEFYEDKLYIADTNNHLIRVYDLKTNVLKTLDIRA